MKFSLATDALKTYLEALSNQHLPDGKDLSIKPGTWQQALERTEHCFGAIGLKYFRQGEGPYFNHLNTDHMSMLLYIVCNQAYRDSDERTAEKLFYLNKIMHGIDAFYSVELPSIFLFVHPLGTILGHAHYEDYFVTYQNVTVGSDIDGVFPHFGQGCVLYAGATVLGNVSSSGNNIFAARTFCKNYTLPDNSNYLGHYPTHKTGTNKLNIARDIFHSPV